MNKKSLECYLVDASVMIVDAMRKIDENGQNILFVVDDRKRLAGSITDGDIRRWLIKTGELSVTIDHAANKNPKYLYSGDRNKAQEYMKQVGIRTLPLLAADMTITDILFDSDAKAEIENDKKNALKNISVIVMAGGKGTRLYPYTKILPKPLIPIGEIPIVERIINSFCEYGVSDFYMTVNYRKSMIKSYFSDLSPEYSIQYVEEDKPLGTAGSIKLIDRDFDTPVIVTNCDILINTDYSKAFQYHEQSGNMMTIVSALKNIEVPYGVLHSKEQGIVTSMEEKPKLSYFINTGMYILNPDMLKKIPQDTFFHMTDLADVLMKEGLQVGMYPVSEDSFLDMGEFEEMRRMEEKLNL